ncbi:MAG: hypothetical protein ABSA66_15695 [Roseiarcus sp.]|jgi:hypothetical protein
MILSVSDHALVRFLERAGGLDVEALRASLTLSLGRAADAAETLGLAQFTIKADGLAYLVSSGVVVTVMPDDAKPQARTFRR